MSVNQFDKLDAYCAAIEFVGLVRPLVLKLKRTDLPLADQLDRATVSIPCNLAEGAGEFSRGDKTRFYRYALRSTTESIAILDICGRLEIGIAESHAATRELGMRLVAMLTRLVLVTSGHAPLRPLGQQEQTGTNPARQPLPLASAHDPADPAGP
jgi:four helix bundle protein